jgi:hypothetical protein
LTKNEVQFNVSDQTNLRFPPGAALPGGNLPASSGRLAMRRKGNRKGASHPSRLRESHE